MLTNDVTLPSQLTILKDKTIDLNGKTLTVPELTVVDKGAKLTINDSKGSGTYTCKSGYGFYAKYNGTIVINGGNFNSLDSVLTGNNTTGNMNFEVNGGTLTSDRGPTIYMPGQGNLKVTNGTLNGGISALMGQIEISGGTIVNTNPNNTDAIDGIVDNEHHYGYNFSGNVWYGSAIALTTGKYTSSDATYGNSLNVKISGGTIKSTMGDAVSIYGLGKTEQNVKVSITGGTFTGNDNDVKFYDLRNEDYVTIDYKKVNNNNNVTITGGTFKYGMNTSIAATRDN